ncbi:MAG: tetratricopeptide repeat protein [Ahrensia sp.]
MPKTTLFAALTALLVTSVPLPLLAQEAAQSEQPVAEDAATDQAADDAVEAPSIGDGGATEETRPIGSEPVPSRFGEREPDAAFGAFQRGLYLTARNLALPRAEAGDKAAQTLLAEIYSRGLGVAKNQAEAKKWYQLAAQQGVPEAEFRYGLILLAEGGEEKRAQGRVLMEKAAANGNALASFNLAQLILTDRLGNAGRATAFPHFMDAAKQGIPDAQYAVAQYYANGVEPVTEDLETAAFWLSGAAAQNFDTAQLEYGQMLLSGVGVERNLKQGFSWIARAARTGNVVARAELAKLYWGGIGVEPDVVLAGAWFVLTRRAGYRDRVLDDFWEGLSEETQLKAIEAANKL